VLKAIIDGRLPVKMTIGSAGLVNDLYVEEIDVWVDFLNHAQGIAIADALPLSSPEAAFYMDMSVGAAQSLFNFKKELIFKDIQAFRRKYILLDHISCIAATCGEKMSRDNLYRRLDASGLRSRGDRFVDRKRALRHLDLERDDFI
jgi:hypothetical protein